MKRTMMVLLVAGMVFLSSCGRTVYTQEASGSLQENAGTTSNAPKINQDKKTVSGADASSDGNNPKSENESNTSDKQIDAVSSATLQTGRQSFVWDLTND